MKYMGTVGRSRERTSQAEEKASAKAFQKELSWFVLRNKKKKSVWLSREWEGAVRSQEK